MAAIVSPDPVYDPVVQVFGTIFVGFIGLMFVARITLLFVELLRQRHDERITPHEALLRELDPIDREEFECDIVEAVQSAGGSISPEQLQTALYGQADEAQRRALILRLRAVARRAVVQYVSLRQALICDENPDDSEEDVMPDGPEPDVP